MTRFQSADNQGTSIMTEHIYDESDSDDDFEDEIEAEDKKLGWQAIAVYQGYGVPKTLSDRIARIRLEIKNLRDRRHHAETHKAWWLEYTLELVKRHDALTDWIEAHKNQTFVCFSDDTTDDGAFPYPYGPDAAAVKEWCAEHDCDDDESDFDDLTMWEYAAQCPGSNRHYMAFKTSSDAGSIIDFLSHHDFSASIERATS
jgi:hypothetical protein